GIRDRNVTGVQTCALPIYAADQLHGVVVQLVLLGQGVDAGVDLHKVFVEDLGGQLFDSDAQLVRHGLHALAGRAGVAVGEVLGQIGRASCRERVRRAEGAG